MKISWFYLAVGRFKTATYSRKAEEEEKEDSKLILDGFCSNQNLFIVVDEGQTCFE